LRIARDEEFLRCRKSIVNSQESLFEAFEQPALISNAGEANCGEVVIDAVTFDTVSRQRPQ
jgi:hypothetical protein